MWVARWDEARSCVSQPPQHLANRCAAAPSPPLPSLPAHGFAAAPHLLHHLAAGGPGRGADLCVRPTQRGPRRAALLVRHRRVPGPHAARGGVRRAAAAGSGAAGRGGVRRASAPIACPPRCSMPHSQQILSISLMAGELAIAQRPIELGVAMRRRTSWRARAAWRAGHLRSPAPVAAILPTCSGRGDALGASEGCSGCSRGGTQRRFLASPWPSLSCERCWQSASQLLRRC